MRSQGLDISDSFIRFVVLERHGQRYRLPIRAEMPVPSGAIVDGELRQPAVVVDLLRQLLTAANISHARPVVSLPERHTFIKLIPLTVTDVQPATITTALQTVAEQHVPYALAERTNPLSWLPRPLPSRVSRGNTCEKLSLGKL